MSVRHTMKARRVLTAVAITAGLALTVAGCGDGGGGAGEAPPSSAATGNKPDEKAEKQSPQQPAEKQVLAEAKGGDNITLVINSAVRDAGGFVTVNGKVKNGGGNVWTAPGWQGKEQELARNSASMAGASLVDRTGKKKYLVLRDTDGRCLCTNFATGFTPGSEREFFAQFPAPPPSASKVDFQIADMPAMTIEISGSE
ncbi:hypothetical protein OG897_24120 [Streptomyces sp. NBC_00237]|nr:hypothetical protein [Streptomyces sp. NBC_00237]